MSILHCRVVIISKGPEANAYTMKISSQLIIPNRTDPIISWYTRDFLMIGNLIIYIHTLEVQKKNY